MTGDNDLVTLAEPLPGVVNEQGTRIAAGMLTPFPLAPGAQETGEAPEAVGGDKEVDQFSGKTTAQEGTIKAVTFIGSVDQVAVAEKDFFTVQGDGCLLRKDRCLQSVAHKGAEMEIVIPFDPDDAGATFVQTPQCFEHRHIGGKDDVFVTDPEFKDVAKEIKGADLPLFAL